MEIVLSWQGYVEVYSGRLGVNEGIFCVSQQCSGVGGGGWGHILGGLGWVDIFYGWMGVGEGIFWVGVGGWTIFMGGWGGVGVSGGIFWVGGGGWTFFMSGWWWVEVYFAWLGWVEVSWVVGGCHSF